MSELIRPESVTPEELDKRLAEGYFRAADCFHRSELICDGIKVLSPINIRIPLAGHSFPKSRIRQLKKTEHLRIEYTGLEINEEVIRIYEQTKRRFMGYVAESLEQMLFGDDRRNMFDTRMVRIFEGDKLIACSFFDLGYDSVASISGLHDPEYNKLGLGILTMLHEIKYAKKTGRSYYYPGYVFNGSDKMDYKLSLGEYEYRVDEDRWEIANTPKGKAIKSFEKMQKPIANDMLNGLTELLSRILTVHGLRPRNLLYPVFDAPVQTDSQFDNVRTARILALGNNLFAEFNLKKNMFRLFFANHAIGPANEIMKKEAMFEGPDSYREGFIGYGSIVAESTSPFEIALLAKSYCPKGSGVDDFSEILAPYLERAVEKKEESKTDIDGYETSNGYLAKKERYA